MKITEYSVPPCGTTKQNVSEDERRGMAEKSNEFAEAVSDVYRMA